jgi:hypothetical protein
MYLYNHYRRVTLLSLSWVPIRFWLDTNVSAPGAHRDPLGVLKGLEPFVRMVTLSSRWNLHTIFRMLCGAPWGVLRCVKICWKALHLSINTLRVQRSPSCYSEHVQIFSIKLPEFPKYLSTKKTKFRFRGYFAENRPPSLCKKSPTAPPPQCVLILFLPFCRAAPCRPSLPLPRRGRASAPSLLLASSVRRRRVVPSSISSTASPPRPPSFFY